MLHYTPFEVPFSHDGYYYLDNKFEKILPPGYYKRFWFGRDKGRVINIPTSMQATEIRKQEILTHDNITLRISAYLEYVIIDGKLFIENFYPPEIYYGNIVSLGVYKMTSLVEIYMRTFVYSLESTDLSEAQVSLKDMDVTSLNTDLAKFWIEIKRLAIKDIGFPKKIQDLFAQKLEANIRSKTDLENARTAVATARALKNASQSLHEDADVKFLYYLETMSKIAASGKHNFHFGNQDMK